MTIAIAAALLLAIWLNVGTQKTSPTDLVRLALTIAGGVGGVVALVVAYRRQRDLEQGRFVEGFGAATKQLGDSDPAVRMAGVYAMAGVADQTSEKLQRQQCIDVLCGYLRLPYSPELGGNHQKGSVIKKPVHRRGGVEEEVVFQYRQNDKEVRQTIVRVVTAHLQKGSENCWSACDFDFTGSVLENASFEGATFSGMYVTFEGATFSGEYASFNGATFSGEYASFNNASFSGEYTMFDKTTFSSEATIFKLATFSSETTSFEVATFSSETTSIKLATFNSNHTSFAKATFSSAYTKFDGATFSGGSVSFEDPKAWNPAPTFDWDRREGAPVAPKPANVLPADWPPQVILHPLP